MNNRLLLGIAMLLGGASSAAAQLVPPASIDEPARRETPWATIRFHAGPNLNLMKDWRDGLSQLEGLARDRGLSPEDRSCICMSWGTASLVHVMRRVALGGEFEMLRDTRGFSVQDWIQLLGTKASFGFSNETVVRTTKAVAAFYPREGSRTHIQIGGGVGRGHTTLSTPGGDASGRVRGWLLSTSIGTEAKFWYVDAGWRFHRMQVTLDDVQHHDIGEARDVFATEAEFRQFVQQREVDFTGGWARVGVVLHLGRR